MTPSLSYTDNHFFHIPKVDLHRHLEGSIRLSTIAELAHTGQVDLPTELSKLRPLVQICPGESRSSAQFLSKFRPIRKLFISPEYIQRVVREVVQDAAADHVQYLELRFTPAAFAHARSFSYEDVFQWVLEAGMEQARQSGIKLGFLASINRHESRAIAEDVARLAVDFQDEGIVGLCLAGDEAGYSGKPFVGLFREASEAGLGLSIHAGEWAGAESVKEAIVDFGARRIGHGLRILEDAYVLAMANEREIVFEVCMTSNIDSGIVPDVVSHPLREMIESGLRITLNSDDPTICRTTLSRELTLAYVDQRLSEGILHRLMLRAADSAFMPRRARSMLKRDIQAGIAAAMPVAPSLAPMMYSFAE